ncbi:MAG TPA: peptidoglycan-associated lipoprotein Pal [Deltaproteobacteria bacterium]|nr:peptidoglycan-associated lipoprotein Pal [Deltaproteobacteria bacterium]HQI81575.1 peptidoglycan-associated lipoprotein Pal [Deltaproteobacteria bacterium]
MGRKNDIASAVIMLGVALFLAGCPKQALEPVGAGGPQPQAQPQQESPAMTPEQPAMQMEPYGGASGQGAVRLDQARQDFQDADIMFEYDSFSLTAEAKKVLAEKARFLNAHPGMKVLIEGHCDERGTAEYNLALGERRAKAAQEYLVFLGVNAQRLSTISYGEEKPLDPEANEAAWAKNRRAHFVITEG